VPKFGVRAYNEQAAPNVDRLVLLLRKPAPAKPAALEFDISLHHSVVLPGSRGQRWVFDLRYGIGGVQRRPPIMCHLRSTARYEIRFESLFHAGRALTFPCDAQGHVRMDDLSDRARENYLYARAVVGREFASPVVQESDLH
jgi:hypothetical protein